MRKQCQHNRTTKRFEVGEEGDIERMVCSDCAFVLEEVIVQDNPAEPENPVRKKRAKTKLEDASEPQASLKKPLTASEMAQMAIETREAKLAEKTNSLVNEALSACAKAIAEGDLEEDEFDFLVKNGQASGKVVQATVKELRDLGYRVSREPNPAEGTWLKIKWGSPKKKTAAAPKKPAKKKPGRPRKKAPSSSQKEPQKQ